MMYNNKLAIALKARGKVLREFKDTVYVPFGTEYSILIKNLNTVKVAVTVSIDGTDATEGCRLIIDPNKEMDLTRFIKNGNLNTGNRFKFIERTSSIEDHRGIKVDDGLIRIEFEFQDPTKTREYILKNINWDNMVLKGSTGGSVTYGSPKYFMDNTNINAPSLTRGIATNAVTMGYSGTMVS